MPGSHGFTLDGKPFFLYSGEIHYFRVSRELWKLHLEKLKAIGANTVSTYIPWSWHEISEGQFDFTGQTDPQRDLLGFMQCVADAGLFMSVKPGPYILAEFADRGIPGWLFHTHPKIQARGVDMAAYLHPVFLEYTRKWYDAVMPLLAERQASRGGKIILMQVCNEVGLYNWLEGAGDTSPVSMKYFREFLKRQYKQIGKLNKLYGAAFRSFASISAPRKPTAGPGDYVRWNDWHDFHRWYYAEYISRLIGEIRQRGIDIQLFHNIAGWVYGRGNEYPVNISFYTEIIKRNPELLFAVDHIPENPNYRSQHDDLVINEMVRALHGSQKPLWAAEQQAGTREHNVHTFPNEMELFYKACLGRGMMGMNLYMFSQGLNPARRGAFGPAFYWMTGLGHDGTEKPLYPVLSKLGRIIQTFGQDLIQTKKRASIGAGFYLPYYHDEFYYPLFGGVPNLNAARSGLRYDPKMMRNTYYFDGMLRILVMQNREFEMFNLQADKPDPGKIRQLWVMALDCMDRKAQEQLAAYVEAGGHLFIWPGFPDKDLKMRPCSILRKRLGIREGASVKAPGIAKMDILGLKDINVLSPIRTFSAPQAKEIARTPDGQCCGLTHRAGQGQVTVLGSMFGYNIKEQLWAFEKLCGLEPAASPVEIDNQSLQAHVRYGRDSAFLCLLNYTPVSQAVCATVTNVPGLGGLRIPDKNKVILAPLSGIIIPLNFPLPKNMGRLLWTTCEILGLTAGQQGVEMLIQTSSFQETEMLIELPESMAALEVKLDGLSWVFERGKKRVRIRLPQVDKSSKLEILG